MARRLVVREFGPPRLKGPDLAMDGAEPPAVGTGLLRTQGGGLLFEQGLQGAFGEAGGRGLRDLLHGVEIDIKAGAVRAKGATRDNSAPRACKLLDFVELLGRHSMACHSASGLRVNAKSTGGPTADDLRNHTSCGKAVHDLSHQFFAQLP
jgi:hypothetical protein